MVNLPFIIDGHNDVLSKLASVADTDAIGLFANGGTDWHLNREKMLSGGLLGGFFALWGPSDEDTSGYDAQMEQPAYDIPLPAPLDQDAALARGLHLTSLLLQLQEAGCLRICTSVQQIRQTCADGQIAAILHMEGAEAIGPDLRALDVFYAAGLRSLGPVWSRNNIFCDGVPFRYPSSPDTGAGLTEAGRALVQRCNALGIMIDLSHITEKGFWDVASLSNAPLVATHSCVHAICPHARNLTDKQLRAVADSGGVVGLNYATQFLRPDGKRTPDVPLDLMLQHLDHMINLMGDQAVALGSDYDGATVPRDLDGADRLPALLRAMQAHGYNEDRIARIAHENWLRVLTDVWGE